MPLQELDLPKYFSGLKVVYFFLFHLLVFEEAACENKTTMEQVCLLWHASDSASAEDIIFCPHMTDDGQSLPFQPNTVTYFFAPSLLSYFY